MKDRMMDKNVVKAILLAVLLQYWSGCILAEQCGKQAGGKVCPNKLCCSQYGYCGSTTVYCGKGCQSQCSGGASPAPSGGSGAGVSSLITSALFDRFLNHHSDGSCPANGFFIYDAFVKASAAFSGFGSTGDTNTRKRELAAFFAHVSHETTGGCYKEEINKATYCRKTTEWTCAPGKQYYGRGPLQITWNYNYGPAGRAIGFDGINNPDIVATNALISFKAAVWFWMTQQSPTCHNAMVNNQGFGVTIKAINGGIECGKGSNAAQQDRINLYKSFCQALGVQPGNNLTC